MRYLIVDAGLHGTGIRDAAAGGFIELEELGLKEDLISFIRHWLIEYEDEHFNGFSDQAKISILDKMGLDIVLYLKKELKNIKIGYFSDAQVKLLLIPSE